MSCSPLESAWPQVGTKESPPVPVGVDVRMHFLKHLEDSHLHMTSFANKMRVKVTWVSSRKKHLIACAPFSILIFPCPGLCGGMCDQKDA